MNKLFIFLIILSLQLFSSNEKNLKEISINLKWKHQFQFAGFYMAKEKGFYENLGLKVNINEYKNSTIKDLLNGSLEFGVDDSAIINLILKGEKITPLLGIFQDSPLALVALKQSGIDNLTKTKDKIIEVPSFTSNNLTVYGMFQLSNITFQTKNPTFDIEDLISGKTDIISGYLSNEPFKLKERGYEVNTIKPSDYGFNFYGDMLFTSEKFLNENQQLVEDFVKATILGWKYAFNNIDETANLILEKYNTQNKSKEALIFEANVLKELAGNLNEFGKLDKNKLKEVALIHSLILPDPKNNLKNVIDSIYSKNELLTITKPELILRKDEISYLNNKKTFNVCTKFNDYPLSGNNKGKMIGISGDIFNLISDKLDIDFKIINSTSKENFLSNVKNDKCDLITNLAQDFTQFSNIKTTSIPIINQKFVAIVNTKIPFFENVDNRTDLKYFIQNEEYYKIFKENYPNFNLIYLKNEEEIMNKLLEDAKAVYVSLSIPADYKVQKYGSEKYKVIGSFEKITISDAIGININTSPELLNILNKTLKNIGEKVIDEIRYSYKFIELKNKTSYAWLWYVVGILGLLAIFTQYRNYKLIIEKQKQQILLEKQSRLALQGEMLSMIAHQWRQPLNRISLVTSMFKFKFSKLIDEDEDLIEFKNVVEDNVNYLSQTINDFANFYKPDKQKEYVKLYDIINNAVTLIGKRVDDSKIDFKIEFNNQEDKTIFTFKDELTQVLITLINNSIEAMEINKKHGYVEIKTYCKDKFIIICLNDNAGGISNEIIEKIFEPYFSTKSNMNGTGLGLYMVKMIVEQSLNGKISVTSDNENTKFQITIPL